LAKPVSRGELLSTVAEVTGAGGMVSQPTGPPLSSVQPSPEEPRASAFDPDRLLQMLEGDTALRAALLELASTNAPTQLAEVAASVTAHDPARIKAAAHKLKGALLAICAGPSAAAAERIEHAAGTGQMELMDSYLASLDRDVQRLRSAIAAFRESGAASDRRLLAAS
jgi:HPt (histidine-containing phosphotransfer) domain-containing protein